MSDIGEFKVLVNDGRARVGELTTAHGVVRTPTFVPCATHGSLRGVDLRATKVDLLLSNIYHLYLRPGIETIESLGGLHKFMGYEKPIITDSGGFQAFALPKYVKFTPDGIEFRSHLDGSLHQFTPELVVEIEQRIGVDIGTCLDVCTGFPATEQEVGRAVSQTTEWAKRSIDAWTNKNMLLYGMVQGSIYQNLRERAVRELSALPFSGFAIGGNMYTFGETISELEAEKPKMWEVVAFTTSILPAEKPRHLLGVGEPKDLIEGARAGVDTFDCVMATRIARHGHVWVRTNESSWDFDRIDLQRAKFTRDTQPLDPLCDCTTCTGSFQRGYLRHLLKANDPLVLSLLSVHNVRTLTKLMESIRAAILVHPVEEEFPQRQNSN